MRRQPALFVSHGSPMLLLDDCPAHHFLGELGAGILAAGRPRAILVLSAHWEADRPTVATSAAPETIHDFHGFPEALRRWLYPAPGAPELAERAASLIEAAGPAVGRDGAWGLDHGAWVPLALMAPNADIPVFQVAVQPDAGPAHHLRLGQALAPLRDEGVLILASGALTHGLGGRLPLDAPPPGWVTGFADWAADAIAADCVADLLDYRRRAPDAAANHPTEEHLLPLFAAMGAGDGAGRRLHHSYTYGVLAMDVYACHRM